MPEQNRYRIERNYKTEQGWLGWIDSAWMEAADTWQDATQKWLDDMGWIEVSYKVSAEKPSEGGRSGIIEIQVDPPGFYVGAKIKATLIEDDCRSHRGHRKKGGGRG